MPRVHVTFLAAHAVPPEFFGRRATTSTRSAPGAPTPPRSARTAWTCYCEEGRFSEEEARWILSAGRRSGLLPRLHACGDSRTGAAQLAAELGCASADLLHEASEDDVAALARAGVAAVMCPGTALQTGGHPPVRALLDKGVAVALGSDHTPGRHRDHLDGAGRLAGRVLLRDEREEALRAATIGGAHALRAPDRGAMVRGRLADMVLWDADHEGAFVWSYGLQPRRVWLGGEPVMPGAA